MSTGNRLVTDKTLDGSTRSTRGCGAGRLELQAPGQFSQPRSKRGPEEERRLGLLMARTAESWPGSHSCGLQVDFGAGKFGLFSTTEL